MDDNIMLPYPKEFFSLLKVFKPNFSKPQFDNFCQITNGISLSHYSSIARFSKIAENKDASSLNKFLTQSPWDEAAVKKRLQITLFKSIPDLNIFIGDDTISEKPFAEVIEGIDTHYSNLKKDHCKGHSIVTTGFYTTEGCIPFDVQMYFRKEKAKELQRDFKTKNEIMVEKLKLASSMGDFEYAVFDSWYSNIYVLGEVKSEGKKFVTQIKSNRNVTIMRKKKEVRNHCKQIPIADYTNKTIDGNLFRYRETDGFISKIGTVRLLYCQMMQEDKKWSDMNYIITNDMLASSEFIISTYLKRNSIEPFHREVKQLGMDKYQIRAIRGIERYLFLVILVYVLLMLLNQLLMQGGMARQTIGELRAYLREDCYTTLLCNAKIQTVGIKRRIAHNLAIAF